MTFPEGVLKSENGKKTNHNKRLLQNALAPKTSKEDIQNHQQIIKTRIEAIEDQIESNSTLQTIRNFCNSSYLERFKIATYLTQNSSIYDILTQCCFFTLFLSLFFVLGKYDFSPLWIVLVVSVLASREINAQKRKSLIDEHANRDETMNRKAFGISTTDENDDDEIAFHLERCEWMNGFLKDLWPYIAKYSDNLLRTDIQNTVRQMEPAKVFKNFEFTDVNLGFVPPRIEKIATYRRKCGKTKAVIMEAHINFCSNLNIGMKVMKFIKAGMKDLVFMGKCRIRFQPLIPEVPFFAAVSVSFDELPEINFDLTDLGNIVEVPGLNKIIKETVNSVFSDMFVRPNKFTVPMVPISIMEGIGIRPYDVMHPFPQGLLKVKLIRGEDLMAKDNLKLGGIKVLKGSSDPYCEISLGNQKHRTKTVSKNLNPRWEEEVWFRVTSKFFNYIKFHCWDDDSDELIAVLPDDLGFVEMPVKEICKNKLVSKEMVLQGEGTKSGKIYADFQYFPLVRSEPDILQNIHATVTATTVETVYNIPEAVKMKFPSLKIAITTNEIQQSEESFVMAMEPNPDPVDKTNIINFGFNIFSSLTPDKTDNFRNLKYIDRLVQLKTETDRVVAEKRVSVSMTAIECEDDDGYSNVELDYIDAKFIKQEKIKVRLGIRCYRAVDREPDDEGK